MSKETHGEWEEVPAQGANSPSYPSLGVSPFGILLDYLSDGLTGDPHSDQAVEAIDQGCAKGMSNSCLNSSWGLPHLFIRLSNLGQSNRPLALLNRETDRPRARNTGGAVRKAVRVTRRKAVATPRADQA